MKKIIAGIILSIVSVSANAALDNIKCMKYENATQPEATRMVKQTMLSITQVPAQVWRIERLKVDEVNRAGYALYCDKDFDNSKIVQYTFGLMVP